MSKKYKIHKKSINFYITLIKRTFIFLLALAVCGCGAQEEAIDILNDNASLNTAEQLPMPSQSADATVELVLGISEKAEMLHPLAVKDEDLFNIYSLILEPGLRLNTEGKFEACIIEDWEVDDSGCVYTFHIRQGVTFHSGYGTVDADDLLYCLDKIMRAQASDCIYARYKDKVLSYRKIDDYTIELTASEKSRDILYLMTFPVLPETYYQSVKLTANALPVGTGPYLFSDYAAEDGFVLVRNEHWWKSLPVYTTIYVKPLDVSSITVGNTVLEDFDAVTTSLFTATSNSVAGKRNINFIVTPYLDCLVPNISDRFLKDAAIRRAVSYAINRSTLISSALMGSGEATATPLSPTFWATSDSSCAAISYNVEAAGAILDGAGYFLDKTTGLRFVYNADGTKNYIQLQLLYQEGTESEYKKSVAELIQSDLAKVGIGVTLVKKSAEDYKKLLEKGSFDLCLCNFSMYINNDVAFLFEDPYNYGDYSSRELKTLLSACASAITEEEVRAAFCALQEELLESMPIIGLYFKEHALIVRADISVPTKLMFRSVYASINQWS